MFLKNIIHLESITLEFAIFWKQFRLIFIFTFSIEKVAWTQDNTENIQKINEINCL